MAFLDRKKLLAREDFKIEKVDLGDDFVYVRQMSAHERDQFERSLMRETKDAKGRTSGYEQALEDFRAKLAVVTICDEKGVLVLEVRDVQTLSQNISAEKLEKIINVAQRLNAITEEDKEALVKNSEVGPADNSSSDSVLPLE